jgi:hypothetical protein
MEPTYRTIYIVQPSHDFSLLKGLCRDIRFLTTGYEPTSSLLPKLEEGLKDFDPDKDAIVAVGKVTTCLLAGIALARFGHLTLGIYSKDDFEGGSYQWLKIGY